MLTELSSRDNKILHNAEQLCVNIWYSMSWNFQYRLKYNILLLVEFV